MGCDLQNTGFGQMGVQGKSTHSFYWLSRLHKEIGIRHTWRFFETGHEKGEDDGKGACMK